MALLTLLLAALGCARPEPPEPLPAARDLAPDRLVLMTHGYVSEGEAMRPLIDALSREGVPRAWTDGATDGLTRYHTHAFDFSRFTRLGSDHNVAIEDLARNFGRFYHRLPETCPVCAEREDDDIDVTLLGFSFGGLVLREFLLQEALDHAEHPRDPAHQHGPPGWSMDRVVTLATPWFGSFRTRLTRGFLSIAVNGGVRTILYGFINPRRGEVFGNVIDEQERALKVGSAFQWRQHGRWRRHAARRAVEGEPVPPWLTVIGLGHEQPAFQGDGVTRFASANVAPLLPEARVESFLVDVKHMEMFREGLSDRKTRELRQTLRAVTGFIERGTLAGEGWLEAVPWQGQEFYLQAPTGDALYDGDLAAKRQKLDALLATDQADVWLRFFELSGGGRVLLPLKGLSSLFRKSLVYSRSWASLASVYERDADGRRIPVVQSMDLDPAHLVAVPDLTPTGAYRLMIRLASPVDPRGVLVGAGQAGLAVSGRLGDPHPPGAPDHLTLVIRPHQTNLVNVTLDGAAIREAHPELERLEIRDIALVPLEDTAEE